MDVAADDRVKNIVADLQTTLAAVTVNGERVFKSVKVVDDVESFVRVDDALKAPNIADIGIVVGTEEEQDGSDDTETAVKRIPFTIIARFLNQRKAGSDEAAAMQEIAKYTSIVRKAVLVDRSRSGNTNLISWGGQVLDGTDVRGVARPIAKAPNQLVHAVAIPIACGLSIFSS